MEVRFTFFFASIIKYNKAGKEKKPSWKREKLDYYEMEGGKHQNKFVILKQDERRSE